MSRLALTTRHVAALATRGIPEAVAIDAGLRSRTAAEVNAALNRSDVKSGGIEIPYPGCSYSRFRLDVPLRRADGTEAKYLAPFGVGNRLYVSPGVEDQLRADPAEPLIVAEGEFKALAIRAALGDPVVAISGCSSWSAKGRGTGLIEDFDRFLPLLRKRPVLVGLDSDGRVNLDIAKAAARLGELLVEHGHARPRWAFPAHAADGKTGLDDLLVRDGPDAVRALLAAAIEPVEPVCFVFRHILDDAKATRTGPAFVGTPLARRLRELLDAADAGMRRALADEAKTVLELTAGDRDALIDGLAAEKSRDGPTQGEALAFADPEPWPEPVNADALLDDVLAAVRKYLVLPKHADVALALWIAFTWAFEAFYFAPRLAATSPTKRCGKTTLLLILKALVRRALLAANVSSSVVFRTVEAHRPTLLLDEWDSFAEGKDELRNVVNAGHTRDGVVMRSEGDKFEPRAFHVWSPAAIAGIGKLPGTVADRAVEVPMRRKRREDRVSRLRGDRIGNEMEPLRRRLFRWATDFVPSLADADPPVPEALDDRAGDNWRPLFAVADAAGGEWPRLARAAACALSAGRDAADDDSLGVLLLHDVQRVLGNADRMSTKALVTALVALDDSPWSELPGNFKGRPLTATSLAALLGDFGISPRTIRLETTTPKGYMRAWFEDAWKTYPPPKDPPEDDTPPQSSNGAVSGSKPPPPQPGSVASPKSPSDAGNPSCVAARRPDGGETPDLPTGELFEERAAVRQFEGRYSREDAECGARDELDGGRS